eukprot:349719-Chlamydomonas_euryale.AAC.6
MAATVCMCVCMMFVEHVRGNTCTCACMRQLLPGALLHAFRKPKAKVSPLEDPEVIEVAARVAADATEKMHPVNAEHGPSGQPAQPKYGSLDPMPPLLNQRYDMRNQALEGEYRAQEARQHFAQQQLALRGRGPTIDASIIVQRLLNRQQHNAAAAVGSAAGIVHLVPNAMPGEQTYMVEGLHCAPKGGVYSSSPWQGI